MWSTVSGVLLSAEVTRIRREPSAKVTLIIGAWAAIAAFDVVWLFVLGQRLPV